MKLQDLFYGINKEFSPAPEKEILDLDKATRNWFEDETKHPEWYKKTIGKYQNEWYFRQATMLIYMFLIPALNNWIYNKKEKEGENDLNI